MIKTGILGGSGYGGSELLRILLFHPEVELALVTANEHAGKRVDRSSSELRKADRSEVRTAMPDPRELSELDCVFLALPHGQAMEIVPALPRSVKVIDLSGDFRLNDADVFKQFLWTRAHGYGDSTRVCLWTDGSESQSDQRSVSHSKPRMLCHCARTRTLSVHRFGHRDGKDHCRFENRLIGVRREGRREHSSPETRQQLLRLQDFRASASARSRTVSCIGQSEMASRRAVSCFRRIRCRPCAAYSLRFTSRLPKR